MRTSFIQHSLPPATRKPMARRLGGGSLVVHQETGERIVDLKERAKRVILPAILKQIRPQWPQKAFLKRLLKALQVDCVFDVGANRGQYGMELRGLGYTGTIISFEPDEDVFRELATVSAGDRRWTVINLALGSERGTERLTVMESREFNSFRKPVEDETDAFKNWNKVVGTKEVLVETLSDIMPALREEHRFTRPFLKMDTQGFDLEVFRGATSVLPEFIAMQSELSVVKIYEDVPPWQVALAEYQSAGFRLAGFFAVNPSSNLLFEMDCYLRRVPA